MYNINVSLAAGNSLLVDSSCTTPRTPEILNSLIAMTNPLDNYAFGDSANAKKNGSSTLTNNISSDSNSSSSSQIESPTTNNPPSVQHTCSQLIKAGLKLSIEQKRKHLNSEGEDLLDLDKVVKRVKKNDCSESEEDRVKHETGIQNSNWTCDNYWYDNDCNDYNENDDNYSKLTPEDEERRRRRRERNKIAATKCRLKKRERTLNLVSESETLETQNADLKQQLQELQSQKRSLDDMLNHHRPICPKNIGPATRDSIYRLPPVSSVMDNHSYSRPASVDPNFRQQSLDVYNRPASVGNISYNRPMNNNNNNLYNSNKTPPSIIVEEVDYYENHFTNLDAYHNQCHYPNYGNSSSIDNGCMA